MPREIKFRIWDSKRNKMYYLLENRFSFGEFEGDRAVSWEDVFAETHEELIPMQYTGLKDKNGKEIYEGDIVQTKDDGEIFIDVVKWSHKDASWEFENAHGLCTVLANDIDLKRAEVIGNIYENAELLK